MYNFIYTCTNKILAIYTLSIYNTIAYLNAILWLGQKYIACFDKINE